MSNGFYGWSGSPPLESEVRGTALRLTGRPGATAGGGLGGVTTSGAPTSGAFSAGEAVLGQDGTLFICTASGSPGTWTQLGTLIDPTSVRGDLIARGTSSTTRLALGSTNQVLTSNGTDAVWAASPASAGGALTQIAQTVLSGTAASVTFSSISGSYSGLMLDWQARCDNASTANTIVLRLNSDSGGNYDYEVITFSGATTTAAASAAQTSARFGSVAAASGPSGFASGGRLVLPNYAGATFWKTFTAQQAREDSASAPIAEQAAGLWKSTSAVTALQILPGAGNFIAASSFTLYGLS